MTGVFIFDFDHKSPARNEGGQLNGGTAWYRKTFTVDEDAKDKDVRINFDGVYMDSKVYVNGKICRSLSKWLQSFFI